MITAGVFVVAASVGAVARWGLRATGRGPRGAAVATLFVNLSGAFALGVLVGASTDTAVLTAIGIGGLGSYTTFSTMVSDTVALAEGGRRVDAGAYLVTTVAGGVILADLGLRLGG